MAKLRGDQVRALLAEAEEEQHPEFDSGEWVDLDFCSEDEAASAPETRLVYSDETPVPPPRYLDVNTKETTSA